MCFWAVILSWLLLLVFCLVQKPRPATRRANIASVVASALAIILALGAPRLSVGVSEFALDSAGATLRSVRGQSLAEKRYQAAQEQLSRIRQYLSPDTWMAERIAWDSASREPDCYRLTIEFSTAQPTALDRAALHDWMSQHGYQEWPNGYSSWVDASGTKITVSKHDEEAPIAVMLETPFWWGNSERLSHATGAGSPQPVEHFAADDWPGLDAAW